MSIEETVKSIEVMQAYVGGQPLQMRLRHTCGGGNWTDVGIPSWDWVSNEYRVKPEPMEFWVNVHPDGTKRLYETPAGAMVNAAQKVRTLHVREVVK